VLPSQRTDTPEIAQPLSFTSTPNRSSAAYTPPHPIDSIWRDDIEKILLWLETLNESDLQSDATLFETLMNATEHCADTLISLIHQRYDTVENVEIDCDPLGDSAASRYQASVQRRVSELKEDGAESVQVFLLALVELNEQSKTKFVEFMEKHVKIND
jgi:hypothetical protein